MEIKNYWLLLKGMSIRFKETDVRAMGRTARGVKALTLKEEDLVSR